MSSSRIVPFVRWATRELLGTDQPCFVAAAIAASFLWGHGLVLASDRPTTVRQMAWDGLMLSLFLMPIVFISIALAKFYLPRWVLLAAMMAAGLIPVLAHGLVAAGVTSPTIKAGVLLAFVTGMVAIAFWLVKRHAAR